MNPIDIVLPAHNEAATIGATLSEFYQVVCQEQNIPIRFVVAEDGSTDDTVQVVQALAAKVPLLLISEPIRKGYSRAVVDGLRASTSDVVGFIDSDGQCDPQDLPRLYQKFMETNCDLLIGYRSPRRDHWIRILNSFLFKQVYHFYFRPGLRDPSCPYLLIKRPALERILQGRVGILKQGFWWEFGARAAALKLHIEQIPVAHRLRSGGTTQVYKPAKVPRIAYEHLRGLSELKRELGSLAAAHPRS